MGRRNDPGVIRVLCASGAVGRASASTGYVDDSQNDGVCGDSLDGVCGGISSSRVERRQGCHLTSRWSPVLVSVQDKCRPCYQRLGNSNTLVSDLVQHCATPLHCHSSRRLVLVSRSTSWLVDKALGV